MIDLEHIAEKIVDMQIRYPMIFLGIIGIITLLMVPGLFNLVNNVEPSLEKVLPQDIQEIMTINNMRSQFGADMMYIVAEIEEPLDDIRNPSAIKYLTMLEGKLRQNDYLLDVYGVADIIQQQNQGNIPNAKNEIINQLKLNPQTPQFVNHDYSMTFIQIRSDTGSSAAVIKRVVDDINDDITSLQEYNPGLQLQVTGSNAIDKATFEVIISDFQFITLISMIVIAIVVFITFRSLIKGMLPMSVVMLSLIWTMGIVGYLQLTITVVTMVAAAMIMGLGIDFGIHIVHNYFERRKEKNKEQAIKETMKELLRAMMAASFTTMAGFLALLFGQMSAMKTLGVVLAIGIGTTLLGAVFLLPIIVYFYDKKINSEG